jgi:hypothetical protein
MNDAAKRNAAAYRGWERRRENDERVAVNLDADMLPLWDRIKLQFRGTPEERTESFLQHVHDSGSDVLWAVQQEADAKLAASIREYEARVLPIRPICVELGCDDAVHGRDRCPRHYRVFMKSERLFAPRKKAS